MTRVIQRVTIIAAVLVIFGCGGNSSKQETQTAKQTQSNSEMPQALLKDREKPSYIPQQKALYEMSAGQIDTLRAYKRRFNITRDEYWDLYGGVLGNDYFDVWYPEGRVTVSHAMRVFMDIMPARAKFETFFGDAPEDRLIIICPEDMEHFKELTGRDWWYYGDFRADSLTLQPVYVLFKRGIDELAISHEYYQWALSKLTRYGAPRWLEEGVASYLSNEGRLLTAQVREFPADSVWMSPQRVDDVLVKEETKRDARTAYYHAYTMVMGIIDSWGEDGLKSMVRAMAEGYDMDEACRKVFDMPYADLLKKIGPKRDNVKPGGI